MYDKVKEAMLQPLDAGVGQEKMTWPRSRSVGRRRGARTSGRYATSSPRRALAGTSGLTWIDSEGWRVPRCAAGSARGARWAESSDGNLVSSRATYAIAWIPFSRWTGAGHLGSLMGSAMLGRLARRRNLARRLVVAVRLQSATSPSSVSRLL
jgi:hypothetical protein